MNLGLLTKFVDKKINQNEKIVKIEYYKLITQAEIRTVEVPDAIEKMSIRLENLGYTVYKENEEYYYNNKKYIVQSNEVLVAILIGEYK